MLLEGSKQNMDIYILIWCQNELMKMGCGPDFTDKLGFPYSFAKRGSERVPVLGYERVSVSGGELCRREGKTLQTGEIKMLSCCQPCCAAVIVSFGFPVGWVSNGCNGIRRGFGNT